VKLRLTYILFALVLLVLAACNGEPDAPPAPAPPPPAVKKNVKVPAFSRDSAYVYVAGQVAFGPRVPNSEAHQQCKEYLVAKLMEFETEVIEQDFKARAYDGTVLNSTNIIGQINPDHPRRIVLAAHWDSRHISDYDPDEANREKPVMGADDGASGVGVLLEIARVIQNNPIDLGVDIIFFDAEDYGQPGSKPNTEMTWGLGSQHWSNNLHRSNYRPLYGILLDMVGSKGARFAREGFSVKYAPQVVDKIWRLAQSMSYGGYFVNERGGYITDDHYFVNTIAGIPMIDIINRPIGSQTGFVSHWHTQNDDMSNINKRTLQAVGQVVTAALYRESGGMLK